MENSTVKERPILFSGPMVKAILDGRKTQTRRVVKPQPLRAQNPDSEGFSLQDFSDDADRIFDHKHVVCPYGMPGDHLWVRERMRTIALTGKGREKVSHIQVRYEADWSVSDLLVYPDRLKGKPRLNKCLAYSGYREASRITLEITGVRVERLHDISEEDAKAEGVAAIDVPTTDQSTGAHLGDEPSFVYGFQYLWEKINGKKYPWASNPWVWVIEFQKI